MRLLKEGQSERLRRYSRILRHLCVEDLEGCSPRMLLDQPEWEHGGAVRLLPPITLMHGKLDKTVPRGAL